MVLAADGVDDRRLHRLRESYRFVVRAGAAAAAQQSRTRSAISMNSASSPSASSDGVITGSAGTSPASFGAGDGSSRLQRHVAGNDDNADAAFQDRPAHRDLQYARHLLGTLDTSSQ